jgi:hypothetical protein
VPHSYSTDRFIQFYRGAAFGLTCRNFEFLLIVYRLFGLYARCGRGILFFPALFQHFVRLLGVRKCYASPMILSTCPFVTVTLCFAYDHFHMINIWHGHTIPLSHASRILHYSWPIRIGFKLSLSLLPPPVYWQCHDSLIGYLSELSLFRRALLDYTCWIISEL